MIRLDSTKFADLAAGYSVSFSGNNGENEITFVGNYVSGRQFNFVVVSASVAGDVLVQKMITIPEARAGRFLAWELARWVLLGIPPTPEEAEVEKNNIAIAVELMLEHWGIEPENTAEYVEGLL